MPTVSTILAATTATRTALAQTPALKGVRLKECLAAKPSQAVWACRWQGGKAVLKHMFGPGGAALAEAQIEELTALAPHMNAGPFRVPELLAAEPAQGLVLMSHAPGKRLDRALKAAPHRRAGALSRSGAWLASYTSFRREVAGFGGGFWIKARRAQWNRLKDGSDRDLMGTLIARMEREKSRIGDHPVTRARSHGDFCAVNLMLAADAVWGVDIHNAHWLAVAKDIARFLVFLEITQPAPAGPERWGIAAADLAALMTGNNLISNDETEKALPFFLASELAGRLVSEAGHPKVIKNARALAERMLD